MRTGCRTLAHLYPVFLLHSILLPINVFKLTHLELLPRIVYNYILTDLSMCRRWYIQYPRRSLWVPNPNFSLPPHGHVATTEFEKQISWG